LHKIIIVYADGLGFHYFCNQTISAAMKNAFQKQIPLSSILGYSVGILPSIWTSSYPRDHENWTIWSLRNDYEPRPIRLRSLEWKLTCIGLYGMKRLSSVLGKYSTISASIPTPIRNNFVNRNIDISKPYKPFDRQSLLSVFDKEGISWRYKFCWRFEDMLADDVDECDAIVYFAGELDDLGHFQGPTSRKMYLRILDLSRILNKLTKETELLCLFSDHGMYPLRGTVDLLSKLKHLPVTLGLHYLVFLESTIARFWFFSDKAEEEISSLLSKLSCGHFLSASEITDYGLSCGDCIFGDKIYLLNPGIEIFPSFFHPLHRNLYKGMHGYAPRGENSLAVFAATKNFESNSGNLVDISPTVLDFLHLGVPKEWRGKSLVGRS